MNTAKTMVVSALMLAIGYGTHVILNTPRGGGIALSDADIWDDDGSASADIPAIETPGSPAARNPFAKAQEAPTNSNPFANNYSSSEAGGLVSVPDNAADSPTALDPAPGRPDLGVSTSAGSANLASGGAPPTATMGHGHGAEQLANLSVPQNTPTMLASAQPLSTDSAHAAPTNYDQVITGSTTHPMNAASPLSMANAAPAVPTAESNALFAQSWQEAHSLIASGQLAQALATLSTVYNQPLDNSQRSQLLSLLDQLAGTVIYSQQHLLHPSYAPRQGETIAQIAVRQRVPPDFLARVNGINPNMPLDANTPLKIVTGPFRAEISVSRRELTLFLGNNYAGRFAVSLGREFPQSITEFDVYEKSGPRAYTDAATGQIIPAAHPSNPYGAHWIGLQASHGQPGSQNPNCGLHAVGSALDASDSRGCIALSDSDADDLKSILELGSSVAILP